MPIKRIPIKPTSLNVTSFFFLMAKLVSEVHWLHFVKLSTKFIYTTCLEEAVDFSPNLSGCY